MEKELHFKKRTNRHIELVNKYLDKIIDLEIPYLNQNILFQEKSTHDSSKFKNPELQPYIQLTWDYKCKDEGITVNHDDKMKDWINRATEYHVVNNPHHPEFWNPIKIGVINSDDRDGNLGTTLDCTKMPLSYVACMVADWCAVSEERGNTPYQWADKTVNTRWQFNDTQVKVIYNLFDAIWE